MQIRNPKYDLPKTTAQLKKDKDATCIVCGEAVSHYQGPGSGVLCREHQIEQREYGGMGRIDRPHTFHRKWTCDCCGRNVLEEPQLQDVENEFLKRRIARVLMHGDHHHERKSEGGSDGAENVKSLCYVCHAKKTILNEDFLNPNKPIKQPLTLS